jgi:ATP-dependent DNA helicase RecG
VLELSSPIQFLKGVGPQRAEGLRRLGVETVEDLLHHLPMRYEDRSRYVPIRDLRPGMRAAVAGRVVVAGVRRARRMPIFEALVDDGTGRVKALWFNQAWLREVILRDRQVALFGPVERDSLGGRRLLMSSPEHELVEDLSRATHSGRIVPVYEKLGPVTGRVLRRIMAGLAEALPEKVPDPLPPVVRERLAVTDRRSALHDVHAPAESADIHALNDARSPAHRRLILEEFFLFQLGLARQRRDRAAGTRGHAFRVDASTREMVKRILPFRLTEAQRRVSREIAEDLQAPRPMTRLLQGDVGAGKTVVALLAMAIVVENGWQAAFMAPTEILAEQHLLSLRRLLRRCPWRVELVSSAVKGRERSERLQQLERGEIQIAVGTHALIQEAVRFQRLGLAVVDEQHRFGVLQREELRRKGWAVDTLVMTATPIPRTLALTAYGDLDVSILDERPPGREPIRTLIRAASERREVASRIRQEVEAGRQAYVVYPLVEESEKLEDVRAATQSAEEWRALLPGVRVGLLHGRLKSVEKEAVMERFAGGQLDLLVATTVIEVGVDVPNATLMVIEHAERFGLAQLHQLRGRVGRGPGAPSTCILVRHGRLSAVARERLEMMARSDDGFLIAEKDLEIRGPGDFFGTRQWGLPRFRVSQLLRDRELLEQAREEARRYAEEIDDDPQGGALRGFLEERWAARFGLARVG